MGIKINEGDSGVGTFDKPLRACFRCGGNADVPQPVKNMYPETGGHWTNQKTIPNPNGNMMCWKCYDNR